MRYTFSKTSLNKNTIAKQLRSARQAKGLKLADVAKRLNINIKYLEVLESGRLDKLPQGLYGKNFLRQYAEFLEMDVTEMISLFTKETVAGQDAETADPFFQKTPGFYYFLRLPKFIKSAVIAVVVLICVAYLGVCLKSIISPPKLSVINPTQSLVVKDNFINIEGFTESEAEVTINGQMVFINSDGYFIKKVSLKSGFNEIYIVAQKKFSKKNSIVRKVLVDVD